jgi:lipopolysaccharide export system permease protein
MRTVRRLLYRDIAGSVFFVALAFLSLFFFIDFVDELSANARFDGALGFSLLLAALQMPGRLYELSAIAVLIGTIYALSRMAQASEFTILRTAGLGPGRALAMLLLPGALFGAGAFATGALGRASGGGAGNSPGWCRSAAGSGRRLAQG